MLDRSRGNLCDSALSGFRRKAGPAQVVSAMISDTIGYFGTASRPVRLIECTGRGISPTKRTRSGYRVGPPRRDSDLHVTEGAYVRKLCVNFGADRRIIGALRLIIGVNR